LLVIKISEIGDDVSDALMQSRGRANSHIKAVHSIRERDEVNIERLDRPIYSKEQTTEDVSFSHVIADRHSRVSLNQQTIDTYKDLLQRRQSRELQNAE
jgi:hypothetical protein